MTIERLAKQGHQLICQWVNQQDFARKTFDTGDFLLRQGQLNKHLLWVEHSVCHVNYTAANGRRFSYGKAMVANRLFGEIELLTSGPNQFDVRCDNEISAILVPVPELTALL
ncbi:cyclic nucleotide-binding domain-containing protein [Pelagibaculum spongiae]|uniref:Cyclic nucleotide-binding domain-containing protein n=1 Tax=Pelagibaculum spongiae TaxID=2080658 RepID=A0A2V1H4N8_9GAMM|nr:cyclic nucleotide-binding domain-containing protein [Pelagibaculum spongiae]PVZ70596.1 hypothetical protein DC094_08435 [Pelagibaculum spongiae]